MFKYKKNYNKNITYKKQTPANNPLFQFPYQVNFELMCFIVFSLLGIFVMNEYALNNPVFWPEVVVCIGASLCMGYYALNDSNNKFRY